MAAGVGLGLAGSETAVCNLDTDIVTYCIEHLVLYIYVHGRRRAWARGADLSMYYTRGLP